MKFDTPDERPFLVFQYALDKARQAADAAQRLRLPDVKDAWPFTKERQQETSEG